MNQEHLWSPFGNKTAALIVRLDFGAMWVCDTVDKTLMNYRSSNERAENYCTVIKKDDNFDYLFSQDGI